MVPPTSHRVPRVLRYSGSRLSVFIFDYVALTLYGRPFQATSTSRLKRLDQLITPHLPCRIRFRLYRVHSPLLTVSRLISLPAGNEMFQFPASTSLQAMYWLESNIRLRMLGSPIRKSLGQSLLTALQSISVLVPSFIGS